MGGKGLLSGDGASGKEHNEDDDDKNNHTDEDNHLHILPPELPGHLLRGCLEVFRLLGTRQSSDPVLLPSGPEDEWRPRHQSVDIYIIN